MKTKPTQHAARTLNSSGIQADFIIARGQYGLDKPRREKLALLCGLRSQEEIISAPDVDSIYEIPAVLEKQDFYRLLSKRLNLKQKAKRSNQWDQFVKKMSNTKKKVKIGVVGKYFGTGDYTLADSYISVIEAAKHACWHNGVSPELTWVDSEEFEKSSKKINSLSDFDAIIVPGGFGTRGVEGIIKAIGYSREKKIPYLGLCYGMQLASVEFARNVLKLKNAHTVEFAPNSPELIIHINKKQVKNVATNRYGGTMRLGAYDCTLKEGTKVSKLYGSKNISERHRHRYEFNNEYREMLENNGMHIAGINKKENLVEIIELKDHPYFVGCQFHPEFKSRPLQPHPLFVGLIKAAMKK